MWQNTPVTLFNDAITRVRIIMQMCSTQILLCFDITYTMTSFLPAGCHVNTLDEIARQHALIGILLEPSLNCYYSVYMHRRKSRFSLIIEEEQQFFFIS